MTEQLDAALAAASAAKWTDLTHDANGAIAEFANTVTGVLSAEYRAGVLDKTIKDVDPSLQKVIKALDGEISLQFDQIDKLKDGVDSLAGVMKDFPAPKRGVPGKEAPAAPSSTDEKRYRDQSALNVTLVEAASASLELLKRDLDLKRAAYARLRVSVDAFGKAHAKLAEHVGDLSAGELLGQVVAVIRAAYSAYSSLPAPSTAKPGVDHPI